MALKKRQGGQWGSGIVIGKKERCEDGVGDSVAECNRKIGRVGIKKRQGVQWGSVIVKKGVRTVWGV